MIDILKFFHELGILPLVILMFAIPGGLLGSVWIAKRFLFKGIGSFAKDSLQNWLKDYEERTKVDVRIEERLADLTEQFKTIAEGLWDNRRLLDNKLQSFEKLQQENLEITQKIFRFIPKRREDWIQEDQI